MPAACSGKRKPASIPSTRMALKKNDFIRERECRLTAKVQVQPGRSKAWSGKESPSASAVTCSVWLGVDQCSSKPSYVTDKAEAKHLVGENCLPL